MLVNKRNHIEKLISPSRCGMINNDFDKFAVLNFRLIQLALSLLERLWILASVESCHANPIERKHETPFSQQLKATKVKM